MSQSLQILAHMKEQGSITALQSLKHYGCMRLAARVHELRMKGHEIETQRWKTSTGKVVARYWLGKKKPRGCGANSRSGE